MGWAGAALGGGTEGSRAALCWARSCPGLCAQDGAKDSQASFPLCHCSQGGLWVLQFPGLGNAGNAPHNHHVDKAKT